MLTGFTKLLLKTFGAGVFGFFFYKTFLKCRFYSKASIKDINKIFGLAINDRQSKLVHLEEVFISGKATPFKTLYITKGKDHYLLTQHKEIIPKSGGREEIKTSITYVPRFQMKIQSHQSISVDAFKLFDFGHDILTKIKNPSKHENLSKKESLSGYLSKLLSHKVIDEGVLFDQELILAGNFIFNPQTQVYRCYLPHFVGSQNSFNLYLLKHQFLQGFIALLSLAITAGFIYSWFTQLYNEFKPKINQKTQRQIGKLERALIPNYQNNLKCHSCKKQQQDVVYYPCQHFAYCENCTKSDTNCKFCDGKTEMKIKLYLA